MHIQQFHKILSSALLADSHSLPLHWNYDVEHINELVNTSKVNLDILNSGQYSNYYQKKSAGSQSHHGDQIVHLQRHILKAHTFDITDYTQAWHTFINNYDGYIDKSSKETLEHMTFGIFPTGSDSTDFCGVAMGLPILETALEDPSLAITRIIERTVMTHNNTLTKDCTQWFISVLFQIADGNSITVAMDMSAKLIQNMTFQQLYEKGKEYSHKQGNISDIIRDIGLGCGIEVGLPALMLLIERHQNSLEDFIKANTLAGADATSRGLIGAAMIGAKNNTILPEHWMQQLAYSINI